ncbi:MAG TPA: CxxC-x17-CxxC domain-containing protein [candidate division Zixibacteria bacterium]|nr:CxxC-x17-CxxC domain-containing protein [candidate division Zixibacteria bacterium]
MLLHENPCFFETSLTSYQQTEVPFKPDGERSVYCQDCYRKQKPRRY